MNKTNLEDMNEEFNNFMYRVTEVNKIVAKLSSRDKGLQEIGTLEADRYLKDSHNTVLDTIDEKDIVLKIKSDRTVINKRALEYEPNPDTMSQEAFMEQVSKDADMRYKDRMVRKEKMETFKKRAGLAFRRGEYESALNCYNKAIEQIKDSTTLYNNRCVTYIKLRMFEKAIADAELALRLDENNFRSQLLLAKAHYLKGDHCKFKEIIEEMKIKNENEMDFIKEFIEKLKMEENGESKDRS